MGTSSSSSKDLLRKLISKEIKPYQIDNLLDLDEAVIVRRKYIEHAANVRLERCALGTLKAAQCKPNIENMIGSIELPLGFAGPILIHGQNAKGEFFVPLATTEGALVASISRGCKLLNACGGVETALLSDHQTRSILFKSENLQVALKLRKYVKTDYEGLKRVCEMHSKYLKVSDLAVRIIGQSVWVTIFASTADAMGMNMITLAGKSLGQYLQKKIEGVTFVSESGNMCTDKKPSALNMVRGRGKSVIAQAKISKNVLSDVLGCDAKVLLDLNNQKNILGSAGSGSLGFNAHFANIISAVYAATGQDLAHVVEGSLGFTTISEDEQDCGGIIASVTLPSVLVGTVGGGTSLPAQSEALSMMGLAGTGKPPGTNSKKLAEITAGAVLAGEISLLGAQAKGTLASSHMRLNR